MSNSPPATSLFLGLLLASTVAVAQPQADTSAISTRQPTRNERPDKPTFIAELDQRFTLFRDTRSEQDRPTQVNLWGARAGFLLPSNVKIGVGYYFTYQNITESEHYWREFQLLDRNIRFATVYLEKFWFRRKHWELSTLAEAGWGFSRYSLQSTTTGLAEDRIAHSIPTGLGAIFAVKLPPLGPVRALRWFGISFMSGYRFSVRRDFPASPINWNGLYYSIGPGFFLDRFTEDFSNWRQKRKARRSQRTR